MARANSRKACPPGKVRNPATKRCVSKAGRVGKNLKSKKTRKSPTSKPKGCPSGKIMNPSTMRCVSRKGKIGMGLSGKKTQSRKKQEQPKARQQKKQEQPKARQQKKENQQENQEYQKQQEQKEQPKEQEQKNDGKTYEEEYNRWYTYYFYLYKDSDCNELDSIYAKERNNIDETDGPNSAILRSSLDAAIDYLRKICKNKEEKQKEEDFGEPPCEVDKYNPDDLSCNRKSSLYLHPDKNLSCPKKAAAKLSKWSSRCNM
jgi:hypothetical protein